MGSIGLSSLETLRWADRSKKKNKFKNAEEQVVKVSWCLFHIILPFAGYNPIYN